MFEYVKTNHGMSRCHPLVNACHRRWLKNVKRVEYSLPIFIHKCQRYVRDSNRRKDTSEKRLTHGTKHGKFMVLIGCRERNWQCQNIVAENIFPFRLTPQNEGRLFLSLCFLFAEGFSFLFAPNISGSNTEIPDSRFPEKVQESHFSPYTHTQLDRVSCISCFFFFSCFLGWFIWLILLWFRLGPSTFIWNDSVIVHPFVKNSRFLLMGYWFWILEFWVLEIYAFFFSSHEVRDELKPTSQFLFIYFLFNTDFIR